MREGQVIGGRRCKEGSLGDIFVWNATATATVVAKIHGFCGICDRFLAGGYAHFDGDWMCIGGDKIETLGVPWSPSLACQTE